MVLFRFSSVALAAALLLGGDVVDATPQGAGGCAAGNLLMDSPGGAAHRTRPITTGPLEDADFVVSINGEELEPGEAFSLFAGIPHVITLTAAEADPLFRGFLIRIDDAGGELDTAEFLEAMPMDPEVQVLGLCTEGQGVAGVTHTNNNNKTSVSALFVMPFGESGSTATLTMDVSMVVNNRGDTSEFYYSPFTVIAATPNTDNPPCPVCGDGMLDPSVVDMIITLDNFPPLITEPINVTCGELDGFARSGVVPDLLCANFQAAVTTVCTCEGATVTPFPTPEPAPMTPQPTEESGSPQPTPETDPGTPEPTPASGTPEPTPSGAGVAELGFQAVIVTVSAIAAALFI